ncbi:MAG: hypothetical protein M1356_08315 [Gammaproteobacteria bacterium]|nr:hypothetical protein [Gammaproteobacteria bacterium]
MMNSKGKAQANSISLDHFLQMGRQASGLSDELDVLKWYGLTRSAINNCRQRGHVPYSTLIPALLDKHMSIDWMLKPEGGLRVPEYVVSENLVAASATNERGTYASGANARGKAKPSEQTQQGDSVQSSGEFGKAVAYFYALLTRHHAQTSAENLELLWAAYRAFPQASELRTQVLESLAATLAGQERTRAARQQR